jgi:hypothetical protein
MAFVIADRVADTSTSTGTGDFTASGSAPTGFRALDAVLTAADTFYYVIAHSSATEWETGIGTYSGSNVFVRTTVLSSSNADALVSFSAGSKDVFIALPAKQMFTPSAAAMTDVAATDLLGVYDVSGTAVKTATVSELLRVINTLTEDTSPLAASDFMVLYDSSASLPKKVLPKSLFAERLTGNLNLYVRTDGSDSNDGLANTSGGAFLTIQAAVNKAYTYDLNGNTLTINIADGTYSGTVACSGPFKGGIVRINGNSGTPANVVLSSGAGVALTASNYCNLQIRGVKLQATSGVCMFANTYATLSLYGAIEFGAAGAHVYCTTNATINLLQNYTISGAAAQHWVGDTFATINCYGRTITITGTPAFSTEFCNVANFSFAYVFSNTFSGSATGKRYTCTGNSIISTGGGATYLPGNSSGSVATQGQYL